MVPNSRVYRWGVLPDGAGGGGVLREMGTICEGGGDFFFLGGAEIPTKSCNLIGVDQFRASPALRWWRWLTQNPLDVRNRAIQIENR